MHNFQNLKIVVNKNIFTLLTQAPVRVGELYPYPAREYRTATDSRLRDPSYPARVS